LRIGAALGAYDLDPDALTFTVRDSMGRTLANPVPTAWAGYDHNAGALEPVRVTWHVPFDQLAGKERVHVEATARNVQGTLELRHASEVGAEALHPQDRLPGFEFAFAALAFVAAFAVRRRLKTH